MSAGLELCDTAGQRYRLEQQLFLGGEGAVFTVAQQPGLVAKLYHQHKQPTPQSVAKLQEMVRRRSDKLEKMTAWPRALLVKPGSSAPVGFLMPKISHCRLIQELFNPVMRLRHFTHETWLFLITAASNTAAAFDEVHDTGCLVGDVNQSNALVSPQALVWLIDCDSFQVPQSTGGSPWISGVGVPHYTPPELQGQNYATMVRSPNHDRFGLAVLIYQLLFMGRHPYAGIYQGSDDPSFEDFIKGYHFALSPDPATKMKPPPHTPLLSDIPPYLGKLFRRAFERGSQQTNARPTALEWFNALKQFRVEIVECAADSGHKYWRGAGQCVWCRIAKVKGGPEYFYGAGASRAGFAVDEAKLQELQRCLAALQQNLTPFKRERYRSATPLVGQPLPPQLARLKQAWDVALTSQLAEFKQRKAEEDRAIQLAQDQYERRLKKLEQVYAAKEQQLDEAEFWAKAELRQNKQDRMWIVMLLSGLTVACLLAICLGLLHKAFAIIGAIGAVVFGVWLAVYYVLSLQNPAAKAVDRIKEKRADIKRQMSNRHADLLEARAHATATARAKTKAALANTPAARAEQSYQAAVQVEATNRRNQVRDSERAVAELEQASAAWRFDSSQRVQSLEYAWQNIAKRCRELIHDFQDDLQKLQNPTIAHAKLRFLRLHSLDQAEISRIGPWLKRALADNGITTAADVDRDKIRDIPWFGDVLTERVVAWRDEILRQFRFDPKHGVLPVEVQQLKKEYKAKQAAMIQQFEQQIAALEQHVRELQARFMHQESEFHRCVRAWDQAIADLGVLS